MKAVAMLASTARLLAIVTPISASVINLPVAIKDTYASVRLDIGTPPKPHQLLFDTGSSTLWMVDAACTEAACPSSNTNYDRQTYNASQSSTAHDLDSFSTIPYLGGQVSGEAFSDVVTASGGAAHWNQTFLSVNQSNWRWITADGFLGMGFASIAMPNTTPLVETLIRDGALDAPRFGLFYGTNHLNTGPQDGILSVGGSHEDTYAAGPVVYSPLKKATEYQLWRLPLRSINVLVAEQQHNATVEIHNGRLPTTPSPAAANASWPVRSTRASAVFDTGAGRVALPDELVPDIYTTLGWNYTKLLNGEERFTCAHLNASWAISMTFGEGDDTSGDVSFGLRGDEFPTPGDPQCMPPVDPSGSEGFALVGHTFLARHYSVFDYGGEKVEEYKPRLGFARLKREWDYLYR